MDGAGRGFTGTNESGIVEERGTAFRGASFFHAGPRPQQMSEKTCTRGGFETANALTLSDGACIDLDRATSGSYRLCGTIAFDVTGRPEAELQAAC